MVKKTRINLLYSYSPYRFFPSLSFDRFSAFHHNQADLKTFMHMRQPLTNYFGSDLLNTIEDMFSLFWGESPWWSDPWAMVFEAGFRVISVIVFVIVLLSFCVTQILPIRGPWDI